jgi:lipid-A-disaccharide synthase
LFNPFRPKQVDLLVIAGEASGDEHAAVLVGNLKKKFPNLKVAALGGKNLKESGADFLFDLVDHAVVGVFEVLKNYRFFKKLFLCTLEWISEFRPKAILLIDYPGFNLRLAEALRKKRLSKKGGGEIQVLQYVSPQLWAWKPKRRFKMAKVLDSLAVIFPFEVNCYADVSLPVSYVGHPFVSGDYRSPVTYDEKGPLLLLPGSRVQPIQRILPSFLDASEKLIQSFPNLKIEVPVPNLQIKDCVEQILAKRPLLRDRILVRGNFNDLKACVALMSSGTMSFAFALAGIPGVIAYKAHILTYLLGKILIKVPFLGMANLLLPDAPPYKELIQSEAHGESLSLAIEQILINQSESQKVFQQVSMRLQDTLKSDQELEAVDWLTDVLGMA